MLQNTLTLIKSVIFLDEIITSLSLIDFMHWTLMFLILQKAHEKEF